MTPLYLRDRKAGDNERTAASDALHYVRYGDAGSAVADAELERMVEELSNRELLKRFSVLSDEAWAALGADLDYDGGADWLERLSRQTGADQDVLAAADKWAKEEFTGFATYPAQLVARMRLNRAVIARRQAYA